MSLFQSTHPALDLPYDVRCAVVPYSQMCHIRTPTTHKASVSFSLRPSATLRTSLTSRSLGFSPEFPKSPSQCYSTRFTSSKFDFAKESPRARFTGKFQFLLETALENVEKESKELRVNVVKEYLSKRTAWLNAIRSIPVRLYRVDAAEEIRERERLKKNNEYVSPKEVRNLLKERRRTRHVVPAK